MSRRSDISGPRHSHFAPQLGRHYQRLARSALVVIVALWPIAMWAILPPTTDDPERGLAANVDTPDFEPLARSAVLLVSVPLLAASVASVVWVARRHEPVIADVLFAGPLVGAATYATLTYWAIGSPVSGANIGAGMMFLLGCVLIPGLVVAAFVLRFVSRRRHASPTSIGG